MNQSVSNSSVPTMTKGPHVHRHSLAMFPYPVRNLPEDLVYLADIGLILQVDRSVEVWNLLVDKLANNVPFASMHHASRGCIWLYGQSQHASTALPKPMRLVTHLPHSQVDPGHILCCHSLRGRHRGHRSRRHARQYLRHVREEGAFRWRAVPLHCRSSASCGCLSKMKKDRIVTSPWKR